MLKRIVLYFSFDFRIYRVISWFCPA